MQIRNEKEETGEKEEKANAKVNIKRKIETANKKAFMKNNKNNKQKGKDR